MISDPFFSILIPAYNAMNTIEECVSSLLAQEYDDYEIIIVDDGSTDETAHTIKKYESANDNIRLLVSTQNNGLLFSRYIAFREARGKYVLFVDSDDFVHGDMLAVLHKELMAEEQDILEFGYVRYPTMEEVVCKESMECLPKKILEGKYPHCVWNKCYSSKLVKTAMDSFEPFYCNMTEDEFYSFVFSFYCQKYKRIEDCLYYYRTGSGMSTSGSISMQTLSSNILSIKAKTASIKDFTDLNCQEYSDLIRVSVETDARYLADIVACTNNSSSYTRRLLKMIDSEFGSHHYERYKKKITPIHIVYRKIRNWLKK